MSQENTFAPFVAQLPPAIRDRFEAVDFVERQLPDDAKIRSYYLSFREWLRSQIARRQELPADPDLPAWSASESPAARSYRYLVYLIRQLHKHGEEGRMPLARVHADMNKSRQQLAGLRRRLVNDGLHVPEEETSAQATDGLQFEAIPAPSAPATGDLPPHRSPIRPTTRVPEPSAPATPRRSFLEILTDPHSIQWFLAAGGGLLVLGLVLFLWSLRVFENKEVIAGVLGAGSLGIVLGGWALLALTRFKLAGRALTLLGCLVLPLNLWFYSASGLLTENLWIPALVCCMVYAASAWRLHDPIFVPVLVAGIALSGCLVLNDIGKFAEIATPAAFLVGLAFVCIHLERAFAPTAPGGPEPGPFSRERFGLAFFWSGHAVLLAGLGLLLGGQCTYVFQGVVEHLIQGPVVTPQVCLDEALKRLALVLVLVGTYLYLYSDLVVRRHGLYTFLAAFTVLWAEVLLLNLFNLDIGLEVVIASLAITGLLVNLAQLAWRGEEGNTRSLPMLGLLLNVGAVALAVLLHLRAVGVGIFGATSMTWVPVGTLAIVAVSSRIGAALASGRSVQREWTYFFATAAATLMAIAEALVNLEVKPWGAQAAWLMILPILYVVAARLYRGHSSETPLVWCGHLAVLAILLAGPLQNFFMAWANTETFYSAIIFAAATVFYTLNAIWRQRAFNVYLASLFAIASLWCLMTPDRSQRVELFTLTVGCVGLLLLLGYRLSVVESMQPQLATAFFQTANLLTSLAVVAGFLQVMTKLNLPIASSAEAAPALYYLLGLIVLALLAAALVIESNWRRWYVVAAIGTGLLTCVVGYRLLALEPWRMAELVAVGLGILMLVASLVGWSREGEEISEHVGFGLALGSLLVVIPLGAAVASYRFAPISAMGHVPLSMPDEVAFLVAGLVLFGAGFILQLKAPTLIGGIAFIGNLVMLIGYAQRFASGVLVLGISLAVGGLVLFGIGLVLSVYRDWLLSLPERIRKREGFWKVLNWR